MVGITLHIPAEIIKIKADEAGFQQCGISKAQALGKEALILQNWLEKDYHAGMGYMQNHFEKRVNPPLLLEGARSVVSVLLSYNPPTEIKGKFKIAKYAYGHDYHSVLKKKLYQMITSIRAEFPAFEAIPFVDSAPVMDKVWAAKSGLGWFGKNGCLINPRLGSFCFIGEIICNAVTEYDKPIDNRCNDCFRCIEACPNKALEPYILNANKCTSYHTIENKSEQLSEQLCTKNYIFGCDICQNVCPYNEKAQKNTFTSDFYPTTLLQKLFETGEIENISKSEFRKLSKGTALSRISYEQFRRNFLFSRELKIEGEF